jgi:anti-sigma factor RsiW
MTHLTEEERQCAADGTLDPARSAAVRAHLAECPECARDVARLQALVARARAERSAVDDPDDLWPGIRARIDSGKIVALPGAERAVTRRSRWIEVGVAAAAVAIVAISYVRTHPSSAGGTLLPALGVELTAVADSTTAYQEQIAELMSDLQFRRAMMRTETTAAVDHDLALCDSAIAELDGALKREPNNLVLRQMLAASYRRKLDLLRRVGNAS